MNDIQMGCGRTGPFFSFEPAGIVPDIISLSKSIDGYGTPMALTLMRPEYDVWRPGEYNGTLRGYNSAFVTAARALEVFWSDGTLQARTTASGEKVGRALTGLAQRYGLPAPRGRGPACGLPFDRPGAAREVWRAAYRAGLLVETAGPQDEVVKILPPLTIGYEQSEKGLGILDEAIASTAGRRAVAASSDEREDAPSGPPPPTARADQQIIGSTERVKRMSVDLVGFLGVVLVAYVVPGPDFLVVVRSATDHPAKGRAAALGAQSGLCVHMLAAAIGLSVLAARSPVIYDAIKLLGAAYLVYLGGRAVGAPPPPPPPPRRGAEKTGPPDRVDWAPPPPGP
ncbi:aminotransferase class III-fold pyridoxal phosphate-dependent enzyme, partial [Streptomyces pseudogriseolus]|uniref:aminotransferase class III-fold pyridoxal phosphate-dependent enzyme n=1 Tax=Streptomyces pseudogriseolus TaxID=36817 RepID=UPI0036AD4362